MKHIILATTSPRRISLFKLLGIPFRAVDSRYREHFSKQIPPEKIVRQLSRGKATAVSRRHPNAIVIGADTVVVYGKRILGKPKAKYKAIAMLRMLNGKKASVITGITVIVPQRAKINSQTVTTRVFMKQYDEDTIRNYVATGEPLDKAGAFAIQGHGRRLVKKVVGDFNNVVGLPVKTLGKMLKQFGVPVVPFYGRPPNITKPRKR